MEFLVFLLIPLAAASPVIFLLVFSEIMAAKEGSKINDIPRKISKIFGWLFFFLISVLLIYIATSESHGMHLRQAFKSISYLFGFIR